MKYIELTQGYRAIVDDEDFEYLNQWKWCYSNGWAMRGVYIGTGRKDNRSYKIYMHNLIVKPSEGMIIDHISRDGLDNRRLNLRECTWKENTRNRSIGKANTTGYKGVVKVKDENKWRARITVNGKQIQLGYFKDKKEAAKTYNEAAKEHFGEFACLNKI